MMRPCVVRAVTWVASALCLSAAPAGASDKAPITGSFAGAGGSVCNGGLHIREKTLEWISNYRRCKPSRYEVIEKEEADEHRRYVFRIKNQSRQCSLEVFALELSNASNDQWEVYAYPSMEAYQKRDQPGWIDSLAPERQALPCMLFQVDR